MCCDHVLSPHDAQRRRLPLLLPDPTLLLPVRQREKQQQQQQQQQQLQQQNEPSPSTITAAEVEMWSAVEACATSEFVFFCGLLMRVCSME
jgi:hypothetical protein